MFSTLEVFIPEVPIKRSLYRCDKKFHLDELKELYLTYDNYALVLLSGKRCEYYLHNEVETKLLLAKNKNLQNQHKTGGQSAQRFERLRDEERGHYVKSIIENIITLYSDNGIAKVCGIVVAGPAGIKEEVLQSNIFKTTFHLCGVVTTGEMANVQIRNFVSENAALFTNNDGGKNLDRFNEILDNAIYVDMLVFGDDVEPAYASGELESIYLSVENGDKFTGQKTTKLIIDNPVWTQLYNGMVGVRYFAY